MDTIKVGFFGFGRTGQEVIKEFFAQPIFQVTWVIRKTVRDRQKYVSRVLGMQTDVGQIYSLADVTPDFFAKHPVDIIVDFSCKESIARYMGAADHGIRVISAISNYDKEQMDLLQRLKEKTAVLYSPNITLGINFLMVASQLLYKIAPNADVEIIEEHFRDKKDVSGTAVKIAKALGLDQRKHVNSIRVGGIVGRHEVVFGFPNQTIRLVHDNINRRAFGQGAAFAARWLRYKPAGLYNMENIISEMMRDNLLAYQYSA